MSSVVVLFPAELSLACVLRSADIQGEPGDAVRELARRLNIRRIRFRPLLPLGRAADWDEPPTSEALGAHADPMDLIEAGFHPVASCGLGQNLYVEPSGEAFPCYAYHQPHSYLGNVIATGPAPNCRQAPEDTAPPCHCERSETKSSNLSREQAHVTEDTPLNAPPPCHSERSEAKSRNLSGEPANVTEDTPLAGVGSSERCFDKLSMTNGGRLPLPPGQAGESRGLAAVLASAPFRDLARHTVDTDPKCRTCDLRYLCGGACRAWGGDAAQRGLNARPPECDGLNRRATGLLKAAYSYLEVTFLSEMEDQPCSEH